MLLFCKEKERSGVEVALGDRSGNLVGPEHMLWSQWFKDMESGRSPKELLSPVY